MRKSIKTLNRQMKISTIFFILLTIISSCDIGDSKLKVVNYSTNKIRCLLDYTYPNPNIPILDTLSNNFIIKPNDSMHFSAPVNISWEDEIRLENDSSILRFIIVDYKNIENNSYKNIIRDKQYDTIFQYNVRQLDSMNWRVIYK